MSIIIVDYDEDLQCFASRAYQYCANWFGAPQDANWNCHVLRFRSNSCRRNPISREYVITVNRTYESPEQSKATIGHEIYHRVTRLRTGLRQQPWLDEMLAFIASQHILRAEGLDEYAEFRLAHHLSRATEVDVQALKRISKWRYLFGMPLWLYDKVAILGTELEMLLDWEVICRLAHSGTWEDWMRYVPAERENQVRGLLGVPLE